MAEIGDGRLTWEPSQLTAAEADRRERLAAAPAEVHPAPPATAPEA